MESFLDTHANEKGVLSAEDDATYNKMEKDLEDFTTEIKRAERKQAIETELNKPVASPLTGKPMSAAADEDEKKGQKLQWLRKEFPKRYAHKVAFDRSAERTLGRFRRG